MAVGRVQVGRYGGPVGVVGVNLPRKVTVSPAVTRTGLIAREGMRCDRSADCLLNGEIVGDSPNR